MSGQEAWKNKLYFGDNLQILREHVPDESVDLIYLDPPFNSQANYNVLFGEKNGSHSEAQIMAFEDTWHWRGGEAEHTYSEIVRRPGKLADLLVALRSFLGENDMMAYLVMMAPRLVELHRALKPTGNLFLHCDQTASHYLKIILDAIFGTNNFRNEIIWHRANNKKATRKMAVMHDIIFWYSKTDQYFYKETYHEFREDYIKQKYVYTEETRRYQLQSMYGKGSGPERRFGDKVIAPPAGLHWRWTQERIDQAMKDDIIVFPRGGEGMPRFKDFLDTTIVLHFVYQ